MTVAEKGSLRSAARSLSISQPALTQSIRELERELGVSLFERHARGVTLTPAGTILLRRATVIVNELRRTQEEIDQLQGGLQGTVVVGLSVVAHIVFLPTALPAFQKKFPQVRLRIIEGTYPAIESRLRDGSIDFYVGPAPDHPIPREFTLEKLFDNSRAILARRGHPLAGVKTLAGLMHADWMTTGITEKADAEFAAFFARHGLPMPRITVQSESLLTMTTTLASTDTLVITARQIGDLPGLRSSVTIIDVDESFPAPPIVVIQRASLPLTPAADHLCNALRRAGAAYARTQP